MFPLLKKKKFRNVRAQILQTIKKEIEGVEIHFLCSNTITKQKKNKESIYIYTVDEKAIFFTNYTVMHQYM